MPPRYTVLLPTHNRADAVGYAIDSVLRQTEPDFELLVVGDGCTDATAAVVGSFGDVRLRWFDLPKAPNFGYANRNVALREADGELVAFMAHDDLLLPDHLALMAEPFGDDAVEWAYSRPLWVADDGRIVPFALDLRIAEQRHVFVTHHNSIPASSVVYRRRLHERVGMWPEEVAGSGDWEMWKRMIDSRRGTNLAYVPESTTLHFRADWRAMDAWGPPPLHDWLAVASSEAWPVALRFDVPEGASAQGAASALLSPEWATQVRAAIPAAMDVLAWTISGDRDGAIDATARSAAEAEARAAEAEARAAEAEARAAEAEARASDAEGRAAESRIRATLAESGAAVAEARAATAESRLAAAEARLATSANQVAHAESRAPAAAARAQGRSAADALRRAARRIRVTLRGNPLFDARWYSDEYGDVAPSGAARHWRRRGLPMGRRPSPHFDALAYLERYPDVRASGMNPLDHFYIFGASEARSAEAPAKTSG